MTVVTMAAVLITVAMPAITRGQCLVGRAQIIELIDSATNANTNNQQGHHYQRHGKSAHANPRRNSITRCFLVAGILQQSLDTKHLRLGRFAQLNGVKRNRGQRTYNHPDQSRPGRG
jgi:hypothetical protein